MAAAFFLSFRVVVFCMTRFIEHRKYGKTVVTGFEYLRTSTLHSMVYIFEGDVEKLYHFCNTWFDNIYWAFVGVAVLSLVGRDLDVFPACYDLPPWVVVLTLVLAVVAASASVFCSYVFSNFVQSLAEFLPLYRMMMHLLSTRGKKPATSSSTSPADDMPHSLLDGLHSLSRSRAGCSLLLGMAINSITSTISAVYSAICTLIKLVMFVASGLTCLLTFCAAAMCATAIAVSSDEESYISISLAAASVCSQLLCTEMLFHYCRMRVKASWATCSSLINIAANGLTSLLTTCADATCAYTSAVSSTESSRLCMSFAAAAVFSQLLYTELLYTVVFFRFCNVRVKASRAAAKPSKRSVDKVEASERETTGKQTSKTVSAVYMAADSPLSAAASPPSAAASSSSSVFQIFVKMVSGETIVCNVEASYSIELIKQMIEVRAAALFDAREKGMHLAPRARDAPLERV